MKFKSLKYSSKEKKKNTEPMAISLGSAEYPWGTVIHFEKDVVDKVPELKEYDVKDAITMTCKGYISGKRISQSEKDNNYCIDLQITDISLSDNDKSYKKAFNSKEED